MCQELWHFLPILPSNIKVSIHIAWHIIATQIFKSQLHFLRELSVCHSHMVTIRGHLMRTQEMRECRPSPKLTSAPPPSHAEEFPWSIVKLCGKFVGMGRSEGTTLPLLSSHVILPDTTSLPLPSSASSFSSWIQERNAPHPLRFWLRKLTPSGTKVPKKWSIQNLSSQRNIVP